MYGKIKNRCLTQGQPKMTAIFLCFRVQSCFIFSPVKTLPEMLFPTSVKTVKRKLQWSRQEVVKALIEQDVHHWIDLIGMSKIQGLVIGPCLFHL